jgi:hypothetical protein
MSRIVALSLAAALLTCPAGAMPQVRPALSNTVGEAVALPFRPPLARPLIYRFTREKTQHGSTIAAWSEFRFTFTPDGAGYRMHVEPMAAGIDHQPAASQRQFQSLFLRVNLPYTARLGADGQLLGLVDEEAYWDRVVANSRAVVAALRQTTPQEVASATQFFDGMNPEARRSLLLEQVLPLLSFAGTEHRIGNPERSAAEIPGFFGTILQATVTTTLSFANEEEAAFSVAASVPRDQLIAAATAFLERMPVTGQGHNNARERAETLRNLATADFRRDETGDFTIDRRTGLARRYRSSQHTTISLGSENNEKMDVITGELRP